MKKIKLDFDNTLTWLSGNEYGYKTYREQVKRNVNLKTNDVYELIFPDNIQFLSISFVQGFIRDILNDIDRDELLEKFKVVSIHTSIVKKFNESVRF